MILVLKNLLIYLNIFFYIDFLKDKLEVNLSNLFKSSFFPDVPYQLLINFYNNFLKNEKSKHIVANYKFQKPL